MAIGRELTKRFEEIHRGPAGGLRAWLDAKPERRKGEFAIAIDAVPAVDAGKGRVAGDAAELEHVLAQLLAHMPISQAVRLARDLTGAPHKALYATALALRAREALSRSAIDHEGRAARERANSLRLGKRFAARAEGPVVQLVQAVFEAHPESRGRHRRCLRKPAARGQRVLGRRKRAELQEVGDWRRGSRRQRCRWRDARRVGGRCRRGAATGTGDGAARGGSAAAGTAGATTDSNSSRAGAGGEASEGAVDIATGGEAGAGAADAATGDTTGVALACSWAGCASNCVISSTSTSALPALTYPSFAAAT